MNRAIRLHLVSQGLIGAAVFPFPSLRDLPVAGPSHCRRPRRLLRAFALVLTAALLAAWPAAPTGPGPARAQKTPASPSPSASTQASPGVDAPSAADPAAPAPVDTTGRAEPLPDDLKGVGIEEHLDREIPKDLEFTDDEGRTVRLGDFFDGKRPVVFNLVYFTCPMLCTLVLNGVVEAEQGLKWHLGDEFTNLTVSIDPTETAKLAAAKKASYVEDYGRPGAAAHWSFLTGSQENITALAQAVGFNYRKDEKTGQFIHTAATFVLTPDGRVSRYLYGIQYEQQTFRLALLEASEGKIGNTVDKIVLYCFHYDAESGRYAPVAMNIVRVGGAFTAVTLGIVLGGLWVRDSRRRKKSEEPGEPS